jgi:beta-glucanase (GH16 family)
MSTDMVKKFTHLFVSLLFLGAFLISCSKKENSKLLWSDEFETPGPPDTLKWNYDLGDGCPANCGWGNNEAQSYTNDLANVRVDSGNLIIEATLNEGHWTSGRITSKGKMNFTYGHIVFRAKLPAGKGTWPALWMLGENISSIGWPACGEIDVMEHVGKNPGVVQSALHTPSSFGDTVDKKSINLSTFDSEFHDYEAIWTAGGIDFLVDGVKFYTFSPEVKDDKTWPFHAPFFIIMNIAMGGNFGGPDIDPSLTSVKMEVDYVRVYGVGS